jgi:hypothetical protein
MYLKNFYRFFEKKIRKNQKLSKQQAKLLKILFSFQFAKVLEKKSTSFLVLPKCKTPDFTN